MRKTCSGFCSDCSGYDVLWYPSVAPGTMYFQLFVRAYPAIATPTLELGSSARKRMGVFKPPHPTKLLSGFSINNGGILHVRQVSLSALDSMLLVNVAVLDIPVNNSALAFDPAAVTFDPVMFSVPPLLTAVAYAPEP